MTNKEIVLNFYRDVWNAHDKSRVADYVREDYIQHNPNVEQGRDGLLKFLDFFFTRKARHDIRIAMEEGDIDRMPIAVKITNIPFVKDNAGASGEVFFALSGSSPRPEMCRHVWNYLHAWQSPEE